MASRPTPREILDGLIDRFIPQIRVAFMAAIQDVVDNAIISAMIEAIESGDVEAAFRAVGFSDAAMRPLTAAIEQAFETGGVTMGATFPKILNTASGKAVFRFDVRNSRAEAWLRDHSSSLVTRLTDEARSNVRDTLTAGMQAGRNPRNVALDIVGRIGPNGNRAGGIIGLTTNQEQWVRSARNKLENLDTGYFKLELRDKRFDPTVARAIKDEVPLAPQTIDKLIARYNSNALQYRGEVVARTEAMQSLNRSEWEATKQAVDTGAIEQSAVMREWDDAGDGRVRPDHRLMNGQRVGLNEPFIAPDGSRLMFPGDTSLGASAKEIIQCRCRVRTVIDWLASID